MNILISVCEVFLKPAKIMLFSLAKYHDDLNIYLLYSSLSEESIHEFRVYLEDKCHATLYPIQAFGYFENIPLSEQYSKPEIYFRLLAPYILPESIDRILYLDADIIINGSLHELYEQDFEGAYAAVIKDRFDFCDEVVLQKKKLGMIDSDVYFNSGVMLMNLSVFRENIKLNDIMDFIEEHRDKLFYFDQDILNCLLLEHKKLCDLQYNFQAYPFEKLDLFEIIKTTTVLHYTDQPKPWNPEYSGTLEYLYWSNALKAGFVQEYLEYWEEKLHHGRGVKK